MLAYNRYRYYDGEGRFVCGDPLGLTGGLNTFGAQLNSLGYVDPLGLERNYRLVNSQGVVHYHGKAGDEVSPAKVMERHRNNDIPSEGIPRMNLGDRMQQLTERGTEKATVRGIEQLGSEVTPKRACNRRGNVIRAAGPRNKRTPTRRADGEAYVASNSGDGTVLGLPTLVTHDPNNPRATNARWKNKGP